MAKRSRGIGSFEHYPAVFSGSIYSRERAWIATGQPVGPQAKARRICYNRGFTSLDPRSQSSSPMKKWDTVAIVGVGLLGGSIGLALQQRGLARHVVGIGRRTSSLRKAEQCSVGHDDHHTIWPAAWPTLSWWWSARRSATLWTTSARSRRIAPPRRLITDVGSTKADIVRQLQQRLDPQVRFVGSHPLAGSEKTGPENASADLFAGPVTVLTPAARHRIRSAVERIEAFWQSLGSRVLRMSPEAHDAAVAMTSHAHARRCGGAGGRDIRRRNCRWPPAAGGTRRVLRPAIRNCGGRSC